MSVAGTVFVAELFAEQYAFKSVIDVGCGDKQCADVFKKRGINYTGLDVTADADIKADIREYRPDTTYDAVMSMHLIEHMQDTGAFINKLLELLSPAGYLCLGFPPFNTKIVGGHVHTFTPGHIYYNLVCCGLDCSRWLSVKADYTFAVMGRIKKHNIEPIYRKGDIERLAEFFPFKVKHGFNGVIDVNYYNNWNNKEK